MMIPQTYVEDFLVKPPLWMRCGLSAAKAASVLAVICLAATVHGAPDLRYALAQSAHGFQALTGSVPVIQTPSGLGAADANTWQLLLESPQPLGPVDPAAIATEADLINRAG